MTLNDAAILACRSQTYLAMRRYGDALADLNHAINVDATMCEGTRPRDVNA
jgi:hypothetical protein